MIKQKVLNHGSDYFYRVHLSKLNTLCNYESLKNYLASIFRYCPDEHFNSGPRSSSLRFKLKNLNILHTENHEISSLTQFALNGNEERNAHDDVEFFLLRNDNKTIAVEIPIWLKPEELIDYETLFGTSKVLSGHIDILRIEDDKVWIWDYKPNARSEKYADTQTFFYALMLSKRTGIDLENFRCGYFDSNNTYIFKPQLSAIIKNKVISEFL